MLGSHGIVNTDRRSRATAKPTRVWSSHSARAYWFRLALARVAFYVLLIGAFTSLGFGLHFPGASRFTMGALLMGAIIAALLARFGTQIALYRRDA